MSLAKLLLGDYSSVGLNNKGFRHHWIKNVLSLIPSGESILDAGAGECQFKKDCSHLKYTSQDFAQYDGVGDKKGIQAGAWDRTKLDIVSDITSIPVPDGTFQNVICTEVFQHLPDPVAAIKELVRVLAPNGKLIITAPFASLTHFAPYHFGSGYNKYFYTYWSEKLNVDVLELSYNGNYFEFMAQELRYSKQVAAEYANTKQTFFEKIAMRRMLSWLQKASANNRRSEELLAFGIHFIGKKKSI